MTKPVIIFETGVLRGSGRRGVKLFRSESAALKAAAAALKGEK
jgi:hypothetical protein